MTIAKVNTDINPLSSGKFGIRGIPALLLFHNGQLVDQQAGAMQNQCSINGLIGTWHNYTDSLNFVARSSSGCPTSLSKRERRASCSHIPLSSSSINPRDTSASGGLPSYPAAEANFSQGIGLSATASRARSSR